MKPRVPSIHEDSFKVLLKLLEKGCGNLQPAGPQAHLNAQKCGKLRELKSLEGPDGYFINGLVLR